MAEEKLDDWTIQHWDQPGWNPMAHKDGRHANWELSTTPEGVEVVCECPSDTNGVTIPWALINRLRALEQSGNGKGGG